MNISIKPATTNNITANDSINDGNNDDGTGTPEWIFGDVTYTSTSTENWFVADNWSTGVVPGEYDNAAIGYNDGAVGDCTISSPIQKTRSSRVISCRNKENA